MLIYKPNFALLTLFSLFIYIFGGRGLKGCAGCRQTAVQTDRQKDRQTISRGYAKEMANRLKTARGRGSPIPVLITFQCLRLMRPLGLRPRSLGLRPRYHCVHGEDWALPSNLCIEPL